MDSAQTSKPLIGGMDWPYLLTEWKAMFNKATLLNDVGAGVTVALVALPLNLALAIAAGVEPGIGIITGIVAGIIGSIFGGQRLAITGPAAAMAVVLIEIAQNYGIGGVWLVGLIAGALQILAGYLRLGKLVSFIPMPVMVGFANGIGILVLFNALDDFVGLAARPIAHVHQVAPLIHAIVPEFFLDVGDVFVRGFIGHQLNPIALGIGILALVVAITCSKLTKHFPGALLAIVAATLVTNLFSLPIPTIASISQIPNLLPAPSVPDLPWASFAALFPAAVTVFMLGTIESLLSASVADGMSLSDKHHSNQELIGQGLANIVVPFFGGIPVTGVIARTAVNIRAGAKTRLAGIVHSIALLILMFFLAPYAEQIPLAALAAILILTGFRLIEWDAVREIWRGSRHEAWAVFATTIVSVCVGLTAGVFVGLLITCGLFIRQMSKVQLVDVNESTNPLLQLQKIPTCKFVRTYAVEGPLFFGAAERFIENIVLVDNVKAIILHMGAARVMDLTGVQTLLSIQRQLARQGGKLVLSDVPPQPMTILEKTGALDKLGKDNVYRDFKTAILSVNRALLNSSCANCNVACMPETAAQGSHKTTGTLAKLTDAMVRKSTGAVRKLTTNMSKSPEGSATTVEQVVRTNGPPDCELRSALLNESNPISKQLAEMNRSKQEKPPDDITLDWLVPVQNMTFIPEMLKNTPIETLLKAQNLGELDQNMSKDAQLVIGMCIDYRKSLSIPKDWAYTIRREGANMSGAEFPIALALSKGINYMALIAHNDCAMANTANARDTFIAVLQNKYGWNKERAARFFDEQGRSRDIGHEIDFVLDEAKRIAALFPGLIVIPLLFRVDNDRLYMMFDWLQEVAPNDPVTLRHQTRLIGKNTIGVPKMPL